MSFTNPQEHHYHDVLSAMITFHMLQPMSCPHTTLMHRSLYLHLLIPLYRLQIINQ